MAQDAPQSRAPEVLDTDDQAERLSTAPDHRASAQGPVDTAAPADASPPAEPGTEASDPAPPDDQTTGEVLADLLALPPDADDSALLAAAPPVEELPPQAPTAIDDTAAETMLSGMLDAPLDGSDQVTAGTEQDPAGTQPIEDAGSTSPEPEPETDQAPEAVDDADLAAMLDPESVAQPEPIATDSLDTAGVEPASEPAAPGPVAPEPSASDVDAEIEALLAEQPIEAEVLIAAEQLAAEDAEQAEGEREALAQRAAEAALALEAVEQAPEAAALSDPAPAAIETEDRFEVPDDLSLVAEIDNLLATELEEPAQAEAAAEVDVHTPDPVPDPTIDQIDQMLAMEAEEDDELAGEFFSSDAIAAGATPGEGEAYQPTDDLDGAFAAPDTLDEPAVLGTAEAPEPAMAEPATDDAAMPAKRFDWRKALAAADRVALQLCWLVNWPARRYLSAEWRATLGYLALLQVGGATAVWLLMVIL